MGCRIWERGAAAISLAVMLSACDDGSIQPAEAPDASVGDAGADVANPDLGRPDAAPDAAVASPVAVAGPDRYALVGELVELDGAGSTGAVAFAWDFGDGTARADAADPRATVIYAVPGRYRATLTAIGPDGTRRTDVALISATLPPTHTPRQSSAIARLDDGRVVAVVTDADQVVELEVLGDGYTVARRVEACAGPRTLTPFRAGYAVACPSGDAVQVVGATPAVVEFAPGTRPSGIVARGDTLFVTLQSVGAVARIGGTPLAETGRWSVTPDARGIAVLPDDRLVVGRWRSPDLEGRLVALEPEDGAVEIWPLMLDPQAPSDTEIGGVPGYLDQLLVAPTGAELVVPSLQANVLHGPTFDGRTPAFDTVLRAVVSTVDPATGVEHFARRKQFDGRGFASAGVYGSRGDYLFVAMRGSRVVERLDRLGESPSGTLVDAGFGVDGLALSADDRLLFALASLSREVRIWDVSDLRAIPRPLQIVPLLEVEPLDPQILLGKQLFNDSFDPRLGREGYLACAHCHLDGDSDRLVWDFTARGEGLRNTISLLGRAGLGHGPVHWSANFDEIQDFEHDLRGPFGGEGLMDDADFARADQPLGPPKAGASADLDALAAYVTSLSTPALSPNPADPRGAEVFADLGCAACHAPPRYTDSGFVARGVPRLHDVGTLTEGSGQRLGGPLEGLDTPTLLGVWDSAPYLHDGSAPTLEAVLRARNGAGRHADLSRVSPEDLDALIRFVRSL